ncbi:hypothetical protein QJQ45_013901, partial [Haematococcus lacustris]
NGVGVMLCTDGWRHKHAALGQPLVNLVLLKPSGGAIFHNVYTLDLGESKTKQFYVDLHNRMANEVTKGHPEQLLGVIMDGPSVNRAALNDLASQHPTWICMTCCVHSMNLICKDLSNESSTASKHTHVGVFLKQVKGKPPSSSVPSIQRISKVLSDGGKITHALHMAQQAKYNAIRHVASHCPTRFAILYKICVDIERSEDAFRMMVLCIWQDLVTHAGRWATALGHIGGTNKVEASFVRGVHALFKRRAAKHYHPVMAPAMVLDPVNFRSMGGTAKPLPPVDHLSEEQLEHLVPEVARLAGASYQATLRELDSFQNTPWSPAMVRQANSILRTSRTVTEPGQPTVTYIVDMDSRRAFWSVTAAEQFPILAKAAVRLLSVHVSTAAAERNWSVWTSIYRNGLRSKLSVEQAEKLVYLKANSRDETDTLALPKDVRINIFA